jgi:hypothetical protein
LPFVCVLDGGELEQDEDVVRVVHAPEDGALSSARLVFAREIEGDCAGKRGRGKRPPWLPD